MGGGRSRRDASKRPVRARLCCGAMWVFPLAAALVAVLFAAALVRRYAARRRSYEVIWALALLMYAAASLAVAFGVANGWTSGEFRVYWALGAVLNVPFLAQGELDLLIAQRGSPVGAVRAARVHHRVHDRRRTHRRDPRRGARAGPALGQGGVRRRNGRAPAAAAHRDPGLPRVGRRDAVVGVADAWPAGAQGSVLGDAPHRVRRDDHRRVRLRVRGARLSRAVLDLAARRDRRDVHRVPARRHEPHGSNRGNGSVTFGDPGRWVTAKHGVDRTFEGGGTRRGRKARPAGAAVNVRSDPIKEEIPCCASMPERGCSRWRRRSQWWPACTHWRR